MRDKPPPPPAEDIPAWFMTYSDVITLLMTFFILLLTFSTNEPEMFEKMQISLFGGGGASGIAGPPPEGADRDAWVLRVRPASSRYALHGSEMPPLLHGPTKEAVNKGLEVMETNRFDPTTTHVIQMPIAHLLSERGELSTAGRTHMGRLARVLLRHPVQLTVEVSAERHLPAVLAVADRMIQERGVTPGHIAVSLVHPERLAERDLRLIVNRTERR